MYVYLKGDYLSYLVIFFSLQNSFHLTILIQQINLKHGLGHRQSPEMTHGAFAYNLVSSHFIYMFISPPLDVSYMRSGNSVFHSNTLKN